MRLLLDTNALLWWLHEDPRLRHSALEIIRDPENTVFVSPISIWEIAVKAGIGKLDVGGDLLAEIRKSQFQQLDITFEHALKVRDLPPIHKDPFDRMLIAQAIIEDLTVVTGDKVFEEYAVTVVRA